MKLFRILLRIIVTLAVVCIVVYLYFAMTFQPLQTIPYYQNQVLTQVIAHQGGLGERPANTMLAFDWAEEIGVDAFELDVHMTHDGVLVVIHDDTVNRTTDGSGPIREMNYSQIKELDAGYTFEAVSESGEVEFPYRGQGATIPTLEEVLTQHPSMRILLEIKPDDIQVAEAVCQILRTHEATERVIVSSFHGNPIRHFRTICPEVGTSATENEVMLFFLLNRLGLERLLRPAYNSFALPLDASLPLIGEFQLITDRLVRGASLLNVPVEVWTVNEDDELRYLLNLGVSGIITDYPTKLLAFRSELASRSELVSAGTE
ncbi:MAG: glycerophosphodiester phosphodiesterase [Anaerolineaceae bacterium]|nr:glycerophosphodiester phosphodiesterase [Anaerolineaceae bacterium]MCY3935267.1 glycerophosphodiester phosphodiesterase [Chloroflexota bacterium]MCY4008612.1 glycerophosphodiester phosphodiesterase [Anaerolineaceae bacterium]MCY4106640.1 glycerophosphodiester phosphodiesterase [Chloroflexota bacterium]